MPSSCSYHASSGLAQGLARKCVAASDAANISSWTLFNDVHFGFCLHKDVQLLRAERCYSFSVAVIKRICHRSQNLDNSVPHDSC